MLLIIAFVIVLWLTMRFYVAAMYFLAAAVLWGAQLAWGLLCLVLRLLACFALGVCRGALAELAATTVEQDIAAVVVQIKRGRR